MGAKIAVFILTTAVCLAAAVVLFFGMILAMNGYSESNAVWGMSAYATLAVLTAMLAGGGAVLVRARLAAKFSSFLAVLFSVLLCSVAGIVVETVCSIFGILVAELARTNF